MNLINIAAHIYSSRSFTEQFPQLSHAAARDLYSWSNKVDQYKIVNKVDKIHNVHFI